LQNPDFSLGFILKASVVHNSWPDTARHKFSFRGQVHGI
jgi:hypothetical protein